MLAIVVTAFANPQVKNEMKKISSVSISDFIRQNEDEQNTNAADSIMITVFNQTSINDSVTVCDTMQIPVAINLTGNIQDTVIIITNRENRKISNSNAIIIVDGKIVDNIENIDVNTVKSISVIKNDKQAETNVGEKNNVILIKTKKDKEENKKAKTRVYSSMMSFNNGKTIGYVTCDTISDSLKNYVYYFDFNNDDIQKFNIDSLYKPHFYFSKSQNDSLLKAWNFNYSKPVSDSLLKNWNFKIESLNDSLKSTLSYYSKIHSDSLKNWNFRIKSWDDSIKKLNLNYYFNWNSDKSADIFNPNILVIVDGKEMKLDEFEKMGKQVGTISVLKDSDAIKKYGKKALKGVIIIETKK
jgi:hypothetical protein